ncbi:hypothetical protein SAMN05216353_12851 [Halobacillus alkaliphilus]|uniref:Uncharacterized protein n=1 Tax=Halobacillus alkaliphilus TaxID=396056 RepID=A0A1I2Q8P8_9BACI|nr:hypothetical protein [Halobacillus alkaliphilus]SFG22166.1 hypothetical protein SAMN05216353_12851 [Halobacillus alkaliphilus]
MLVLEKAQELKLDGLLKDEMINRSLMKVYKSVSQDSSKYIYLIGLKGDNV